MNGLDLLGAASRGGVSPAAAPVRRMPAAPWTMPALHPAAYPVSTLDARTPVQRVLDAMPVSTPIALPVDPTTLPFGGGAFPSDGGGAPDGSTDGDGFDMDDSGDGDGVPLPDDMDASDYVPGDTLDSLMDDAQIGDDFPVAQDDYAAQEAAAMRAEEQRQERQRQRAKDSRSKHSVIGTVALGAGAVLLGILGYKAVTR